MTRASSEGRFVAGTLLASRYRIVGLLGQGGMGEVYKADDLRLEHPVALKFLPDALALNTASLARFHAEARIARQVSHPNVCRVYDIGDVDGLHFLTMEFIDGEDLGSLLRRIGRLPSDKALEIARQLCAGVAAAHDAGVLHRDLKPANVMIDGRGRARITDFGIAAAARDIKGDLALAGTPAYMAPEQLQGKDATVRSDVYALGLVLYEVFTGKRAVEAKSIGEALLHHSGGSAVTTPSHWIADLDPVVERAILRCLEQNPAARPASAIQVAATLPGGDPLQAALAAGETPSPEMVAAAGSQGAMGVRAGIALLAVTLASLGAAAWAQGRVSALGRVSAQLSPEVLAYQARSILADLGYRDRPVDSAGGFDNAVQFVRYVRRLTEQSGQAVTIGDRPPTLVFWYRESPHPLTVVATTRAFAPPGIGPVTFDNPPFVEPGMTRLQTDAQGRLVAFDARPPEFDATSVTPPRCDWSRVFAATALELQTLRAVEATWTPPAPFDERAAWEGTYPETPDLPIRLEAAAYRGRLVGFRTFGEWNRPETVAAAPPARATTGSLIAAITAFLSFAACWVAWFNVRLGRGDRRGAAKVASLLLGARALAWVLTTDHVRGVNELVLVRLGLSTVLFEAAIVYVAYLSIEPYVRRRWPAVLVSWSRAIGGQPRDPLVGFEVLVGLAIGLVWLLAHLGLVWARAGSDLGPLDTLGGLRFAAGNVAHAVASAPLLAVMSTFLLLGLRVLLRAEWLAIGIAAIILGVIGGGGVPLLSPAGAISGALLGLSIAVTIKRFGLLALTSLLFVYSLLARGEPLALNPSSWHAPASALVLGSVAAIAVWACYIAVGRPRLMGT